MKDTAKTHDISAVLYAMLAPEDIEVSVNALIMAGISLVATARPADISASDACGIIRTRLDAFQRMFDEKRL